MNSPATSSEYSLHADDEWDLLMSSSEPASSVPASPLTVPLSIPSDAEFETDHDITDVGSEVSSQPSDLEDPDLLGERILDAENSGEDERVNEALAQSLSSTLEPLKMPLASTSSLTSYAPLDTPIHSNALRLSFPDPLTASNESAFGPLRVPLIEPQAIQYEECAPIEPLSLSEHRVPDVSRSLNPNHGDQLPNPEGLAPISIEAQLPAPSAPKPSHHSYDEADRMWKATYTQLLSHPRSTSIILSILVLFLASVLVQMHQLVASPPVTSNLTSAIVSSIRTNTTNLTLPPVAPSITTAQSVTAVSVVKAKVHDPIDTPGAGPSKIVRAAPSPSAVTVSSILVPIGNTRPGCATPLPRQRACTSLKGKEKEVVSPEAVLLLSAPDSSESYALQTLKGLQEKMSTIMETSHHHRMSNTQLALISFQRALDLILTRILAQTDLILRDLTKLVNTAQRKAEEIIVAADGLRCSAQKKASELIDISQQLAQEFLSNPSVRQAHDAFNDGRSKAEKKAKFLANGVRTQLHRARRHARKGNVGHNLQMVKKSVQQRAETVREMVVETVAPGLQSASKTTAHEMSRVVRKARSQAKKLTGRKVNKLVKPDRCNPLRNVPLPAFRF